MDQKFPLTGKDTEAPKIEQLTPDYTLDKGDPGFEPSSVSKERAL
jgi:hypothetical protein